VRSLKGDWTAWVPLDGESAVTVGVFDGVHLGHQKTLRTVKHHARGRPTVVVTFDPHPLAVLAPERQPRLLVTLPQRLGLFEASGVDIAAVLEFSTTMAQMSASAFVESILVEKLRAGVVVVGETFSFGARREGNVDFLQELGSNLGFEVEAVPMVGDNRSFSSTAVRDALARGDLAEAEEILGRRYTVSGKVVTGAGRGATIGIPTANLGLAPQQFIPKRGVYAVLVKIGDQRLPAVCNIGIRPTFGGTEDVVEVHVLDFDGDIRDLSIEIELVARLRDEMRFEGVDALVGQINVDIGKARDIFASTSEVELSSPE